MATHTVVEGVDQSIKLTATNAPSFGTNIVWVMIDRSTKDVVISKDIPVERITGGAVMVDLTADDTVSLNGTYYYELWGHGTTDVLLNKGMIQITPTYGGAET